jgi:oligopeptide transport system substrate-binding protein
MLLTRDPKYRGRFRGNVGEVALVLNVASVAEQAEMYDADRLDVIQLRPSADTNRIRQRHAGEYLLGPGLSTQYIGFNVKQPPFDDPRVRRAIAMATDKETLASVNLWGYSFPASGGFVPPDMPGHSPTIGLPYDAARARELLAEAGYPDGRNFPQIQGLVHVINKELVCDPLQRQWRDNLGITIEWQAVEWAQFLEQMEREPAALFHLMWRADYADPDNMLRVSVHCRWTGWQNEAYSRLLEEGSHTTSHAERIMHYQQADRLLVEEASVVPLAYGRNHMLVKPWVRKLSPSSLSWYLWKDVIIEPHS